MDIKPTIRSYSNKKLAWHYSIQIEFEFEYSNRFDSMCYALIMHADLVSMLHPSFQDKYFKIAGWEADWINEALWLTREMFTTFYKPEIKILPSSQPNKSNKVIRFSYYSGDFYSS
ncbi:hypothetical protein PSTG_08344 [Puccinia striiformis f. sp. tritici PST-78]|uniref:hAT-like transposase RNase-H fold domain-containing protein n=1 Tax=Puccinia striiformis f. sp. tritici PST-78 TaxID=1165861 RepID=A0A0L0VGL3_9BASI|nr:hypothetical protein PSTG_08344 [Puccinia striiformis f. sp. tritici PST-78]